MVVVAIIGILMGLLLSAVQKARAAMHRTVCINNLRQLGIAVHSYENLSGEIPLSFCGGNRAGQVRCFSAHARLLPFLEAVQWLVKSTGTTLP